MLKHSARLVWLVFAFIVTSSIARSYEHANENDAWLIVRESAKPEIQRIQKLAAGIFLSNDSRRVRVALLKSDQAWTDVFPGHGDIFDALRAVHGESPVWLGVSRVDTDSTRLFFNCFEKEQKLIRMVQEADDQHVYRDLADRSIVNQLRFGCTGMLNEASHAVGLSVPLNALPQSLNALPIVAGIALLPVEIAPPKAEVPRNGPQTPFACRADAANLYVNGRLIFSDDWTPSGMSDAREALWVLVSLGVCRPPVESLIPSNAQFSGPYPCRSTGNELKIYQHTLKSYPIRNRRPTDTSLLRLKELRVCE
jgi:hypothetical protein